MFISGKNMGKPTLMFGEVLCEVEHGALGEIPAVGSIPAMHER